MLPDADQVAPAEFPPGYPFAPQAARKPPAAGEPAASERLSSPLAKAAAGFGLVGGCAMVNLIMPPMVEGIDLPEPLVGLVGAVLFVQLAGQSLWIVWSGRPIWQRIVLGTLA